MAIGLAALAGIASASFAQDSRAPAQGKPAPAGHEAVPPQTDSGLPDEPRSEARDQAGVFVAVPVGTVRVGPEFVDGVPSYSRRLETSGGIAVVELSTTPFAPVSGSGEDPDAVDAWGRKVSELPASW